MTLQTRKFSNHPASQIKAGNFKDCFKWNNGTNDTFSSLQRYLVLDYETFSECDLKKTSSYEYAVHPSTEVLCASFRHGTKKELKKAKVHSWAPKRKWNVHRDDLRKGKLLASYLLDPNVMIVAHNALFEQAITRFVLPKHLSKFIPAPFIIKPNRFICTAALASVNALPRKLEAVTAALKLGHLKDMAGHRLMLKLSKPKKPTKKDPSTRHVNPDEHDRLIKYCERDIYAETDVFLFLEPLIPSERELWIFDQEINFRGVNVDRDLVQKTLKLIGEEKRLLLNRLHKLTNGMMKTAGQKKVLHAWLKTQGVKLPDLKGTTVEAAIASGEVTGTAKKVLLICQKLNKTSLKKYTSFLHHTESDGRMRFSLNFNISVHGRWGGTGVQPHNMPRGTLKKKWKENGKDFEEDLAPLAAQAIKEGMSLEMIRLLFGDPTEVFVSCLRCMIIPTEGKELFVSDFNAIEARVLFWLAGHEEGCQAFIDKRKMYEELAMVIFRKTSISQVSVFERFVGKQAFLGSGYGMGWKKFQGTCEGFNQKVSVDVAKKAIKAYRDTHKPVVELWSNLEKAAIKAVENPTKTYKVNKTEWFMKGRFLVCKLPSGRCLKYYGPQIKYERTPWGTSKANLYHWTVDAKTKKWTFIKTWGGVLTQNCVGGISRDLLACSMKRIQKRGYDIILTVHDENIGEREINLGSAEEFNKLMAMTPKWAEGCPVSAEGWSGPRYRK